MENNHAVKILPGVIPSTCDAVRMYEANGGSLSEPAIFGRDPLSIDPTKQAIREEAVKKMFCFGSIFGKVSIGRDYTFKRALDFFLDITYRLSCSF